MEIDGAVIIVTGAGSGIGAATARVANAAGAHLVLVGRRQERITAVAGELRAARPDRRPLAIPTDVTDPTDLEGLIGRTLDEHGRIDVLINNAGQGSTPLSLRPTWTSTGESSRSTSSRHSPLCKRSCPPCGTVAEG